MTPQQKIKLENYIQDKKIPERTAELLRNANDGDIYALLSGEYSLVQVLNSIQINKETVESLKSQMEQKYEKVLKIY